MAFVRAASQTLRCTSASQTLKNGFQSRGAFCSTERPLTYLSAQKTFVNQSSIATPRLTHFKPNSQFISFRRQLTLSSPDLAEKNKSSLKKPITPKGKFDLEDEAKKKELDQIREELRAKEEAEKAKDESGDEAAESETYVMGELVNEETGERGGPKGQEPTEYGDWQRKGRVTDF